MSIIVWSTWLCPCGYAGFPKPPEIHLKDSLPWHIDVFIATTDHNLLRIYSKITRGMDTEGIWKALHACLAFPSLRNKQNKVNTIDLGEGAYLGLREACPGFRTQGFDWNWSYGHSALYIPNLGAPEICLARLVPTEAEGHFISQGTAGSNTWKSESTGLLS